MTKDKFDRRLAGRAHTDHVAPAVQPRPVLEYGAPSSYPFWNRRSELLIECECIRPKLVQFECFREVTHRGRYSAKRLAELALQVSLHALWLDGLVLDHSPNSVRRIHCWHLPPANFNQEFLSFFSCAILFDLLRPWFEYAP